MSDENENENGSGPRKLSSVLASAQAEFEQLVGRKVETVSSASKHEDGWRVSFEVVELTRIPDSTSLLGSYDVVVDGDGNVVGYDRVRRYHRNRADEEA
ncbi:MAG: gas vesicle protein GvpO [Acidimicrobiales bacterium]